MGSWVEESLCDDEGLSVAPVMVPGAENRRSDESMSDTPFELALVMGSGAGNCRSDA